MILTHLSIISRFSRTFFERRLNDSNIGFTEHSILMHLSKCGTVNQHQIAMYFMLDKGSVAKTLHKLEKKRLISRADNPQNRREKLIKITEEGFNLVTMLNTEFQQLHSSLFEGLSEDDIQAFIWVIQRISDNAAKIMNERMTNNENKES
jgi:DNA-binding MarR family transcriptional regulator